MSLLPLRLAGRVRAGEKLVGALVRMPCEEIVEMLAVAGHDFVLLDCEHGPADVLALRQHIAVAQVHGLEAIVRVGEGEASFVLRALDAGASGILVPHVDTREDAEQVVAWSYYPPVGTRGSPLTAAREGMAPSPLRSTRRGTAKERSFSSCPSHRGPRTTRRTSSAFQASTAT